MHGCLHHARLPRIEKWFALRLLGGIRGKWVGVFDLVKRIAEIEERQTEISRSLIQRRGAIVRKSGFSSPVSPNNLGSRPGPSPCPSAPRRLLRCGIRVEVWELRGRARRGCNGRHKVARSRRHIHSRGASAHTARRDSAGAAPSPCTTQTHQSVAESWILNRRSTLIFFWSRCFNSPRMLMGTCGTMGIPQTNFNLQESSFGGGRSGKL